MLFLTFNKADIRFTERKFVWKIYTAAEVLPTTKMVEIINRKEFLAAALNANNKIFVVHVAALVEPTIIPIYLSYQAQVALLTSKETRILVEYSDFLISFL